MDKFFELLERIEKKRYLYIGDDNLIAGVAGSADFGGVLAG